MDRFQLVKEDATANNNEAFRKAARGGHINVLDYFKYYLGLTKDDVMTNNNEVLRVATTNHNMRVLKWLKNNYGIVPESAEHPED